jgi:hypothetical protein
MIEIFENTTSNIFTVSAPDGAMYEFTLESEAVAKAQQLCNCNDEFLIMPFFEDDEL